MLVFQTLFCSFMTCMAPFMSMMSTRACRSHSTIFAHIRFLPCVGIHVIFKVSRLCKWFRTQSTLMVSFTWICMFLLLVQAQFDLINHYSTYWTWHRFMSIADMSYCLKRIGLHFHTSFFCIIYKDQTAHTSTRESIFISKCTFFYKILSILKSYFVLLWPVWLLSCPRWVPKLADPFPQNVHT